MGEKNRDIIRNEITSEQNLSSDGYYNLVSNLLFLLQTRIAKQLKGINLDEDLFRNYFIKTYKALALREEEYLKILTAKERSGFLVFSTYLKELAQVFRCEKVHKKIEEDEYARKPSKKKKMEVVSKMVYGIGEVRSESCRLIPSHLSDFFKIRNVKAK